MPQCYQVNVRAGVMRGCPSDGVGKGGTGRGKHEAAQGNLACGGGGVLLVEWPQVGAGAGGAQGRLWHLFSSETRKSEGETQELLMGRREEGADHDGWLCLLQAQSEEEAVETVRLGQDRNRGQGWAERVLLAATWAGGADGGGLARAEEVLRGAGWGTVVSDGQPSPVPGREEEGFGHCMPFSLLSLRWKLTEQFKNSLLYPDP